MSAEPPHHPKVSYRLFHFLRDYGMETQEQEAVSSKPFSSELEVEVLRVSRLQRALSIMKAEPQRSASGPFMSHYILAGIHAKAAGDVLYL